MTTPSASPPPVPGQGSESQAAAHALADRLTDHGFDVSGTAWEPSHRLAITNLRGALCTVELRDDGHTTWEYRPCYGTHADPSFLVDMVMAILGADASQQPCTAPARYPGLTLKGAVGRALADRGMTVHLALLEQDDVNYDLYAEIEVTNPVHPSRGRVRVTDHAALRWECRCQIPATTVALHPGDIAETIASALTMHTT